jgi:type III restriction enzyme
VELPTERLTATFNADSVLELTPDLVGPTHTRNQGIIGETADMTVEHLQDVRPSTLLFHLTKRLVYKEWRDAGEDPKLHLFGQLKRITKQWLDTCLVCKGGTYPALLLYEDLADAACNRHRRHHHALQGQRPSRHCSIRIIRGSTAHVRPDVEAGSLGHQRAAAEESR